MGFPEGLCALCALAFFGSAGKICLGLVLSFYGEADRDDCPNPRLAIDRQMAELADRILIRWTIDREGYG